MAEKIQESQVDEAGEEGEEGEAEQTEPSVKVSQEGEVTVALPGPKKRKERRAERGAERYQEVAAEARRAREESERLRRELEETRQAMQRGFAQSQQRGGEDPHAKIIKDIRAEQESIQAALRGGSVSSQEEANRLRDRYYELEDKKDEVRAERLESRVSQRIPRRQEGEDEARILMAEYPDVVGHENAMKYAHGTFSQMVAEGKPANLTTSREALRRAAERFGLVQTSAPAPSASQAAKYGGVPAQAGEKVSSNEMRLTPEQRKIAVAAYPDLSENEAYAKWATVARKAAKAEGWDQI